MVLIICLVGGRRNGYRKVHSYLVGDDYNTIRHFKNTYTKGELDYTKTISKLLNNGIEKILTNSLEEGIQIMKNNKLFEEKKKNGLIIFPSDEEIDNMFTKIISE